MLPITQKRNESGSDTSIGSSTPKLSDIVTGQSESAAKERHPAAIESSPAALVFFPPYISAISTGTKPVDIQRLMRKTRMQQTLPERKRRQKPTGHLQMPMKLQRMPSL